MKRIKRIIPAFCAGILLLSVLVLPCAAENRITGGWFLSETDTAVLERHLDRLASDYAFDVYIIILRDGDTSGATFSQTAQQCFDDCAALPDGAVYIVDFLERVVWMSAFGRGRQLADDGPVPDKRLIISSALSSIWSSYISREAKYEILENLISDWDALLQDETASSREHGFEKWFGPGGFRLILLAAAPVLGFLCAAAVWLRGRRELADAAVHRSPNPYLVPDSVRNPGREQALTPNHPYWKQLSSRKNDRR